MHYLMPKAGVLSLHSSANEGPDGDVSLFFGLSGMYIYIFIKKNGCIVVC
jgi:hypothetical protein